jgi:putative hydrolase of the HAD superfamily
MLTVSVKHTIFIFDLDDTLYSEREYERSGISFVYYYLLKNGVKLSEGIKLEALLINRNQWIEKLIQSFEIPSIVTRDEILALYRSHKPNINLYPDAKVLLDQIKVLNGKIAIITDGRSLSQRTKISALSLNEYTSDVYISEEVGHVKPDPYSFIKIVDKYKNYQFLYIGDNPKKDFLVPNELGWTTICRLNNGQNVHKQSFRVESNYIPQYKIRTFDEIQLI